MICAGCGRDYSASGYAGHVAKTSSVLCLAAHRDLVIQAGIEDQVQTHGDAEMLDSLVDNLPVNLIENEGDDPIDLHHDNVNHDDNEQLDQLDEDEESVELVPALHRFQDPSLIQDTPVPTMDPQPCMRDEYKSETFPGTHAGMAFQPGSAGQSAFDNYQLQLDNPNEYAPFVSRMDWEIARWAKLHGPSSTAVTELLQIDGVVQALALSYKNARELNNVIDNNLPGRPCFKRFDIQLGGETVSMYSRDILECIQALYGDPDFTSQLIFRPERQYKRSGDHWHRVFHDMHTGDWWWEVQSVLEAQRPGATLVPLVISSDRTQVTLFGNKSAYPVYLTIGNLPKAIRRKSSQRGQILLAYLPTSKLSSVTNHAARRRMVINLFHSCLRRLLAPIEEVGINGMVMADGEGVRRRVHPVLAVYVGDYPEQLLVTCVKSGECPKCDIVRSDLGNLQASTSARNIDDVYVALSKVDGDAHEYNNACKNAGIKPVFHPFWESLPYVDIFQAITPDILHQLHQGVFKHLVGWLIQAYGASEIDARVRRLIPNHHIRIFSNGISALSRVTGKEHNLISHIILGVISDMGLPGGFNAARLVRAVRGLLDFMFVAQLPVISLHDLMSMERALKTFHDNKGILEDLGIRDHFNIPKLHSLIHSVTSVQLFGSTDNYNTQHTERLHIDYTKEAYRATNTRDEYPQMTMWLERQEKIERHEKHIRWQHHSHDSAPLPSEDKCQGNAYADTIHIQPPSTNKKGQLIPGRFDTVLVYRGAENYSGIHAYRVAQVRVVFSIGPMALKHLFGDQNQPPQHLAYVEWFTAFRASPEPDSKLYKVECSYQGNDHLASIVPVTNITQSIHLSPLPGRVIPREWNSNTVLDNCRSFLVNAFCDTHSYLAFYDS